MRKEALPLDSNIDLNKRLFNDVFYPHLHSVHNYEVYYGGAASGKSTFIGQKMAVQMTLMPGRNLVCLRKQKKDCIKSCWGEIYNALVKFKLKRYWDIKGGDVRTMTNRINGNEIVFEGLDDVEDIKSIKFTKTNEDAPGDANITDIWYEEANAESNPDNIDQLDIRLRDPILKNRLILSFNPVSRAHFLYELVTVNYKMPGVDSLILKTTYKDNRFCPAETSAKYERYKYTNPYMYQVFTLGNWGTMGETIFDSAVVGKRLQDLQLEHMDKSPVYGDFAFKEDKRGLPVANTYSFMPLKGGATKIFKKPEPKHPYVIAVDTAGEGNGDYYAAHVRDNHTQEQVATFHSKSGISYCIYQLYCLACYYNEALVCFESNFDQTPIKVFLLLDYTNMYRATTPADKTHQRREDRYGFRTTSGNRLTMISQLITWVNANANLINDEDTLNEMLVFTRQDKKLKGIWMGAEPGENDDLVMSFAILLQASEQQYMELVPDKKKLEGSWMREDLEDAVQEGRVDRLTALEYARTKSFFGEEDEMPHVRRGSKRYARTR